MEGKEILRPFYPGGDYEHAEYPEDGVVIDNPPFSMFTKICKFYSERRIPFFIFGPGLTIFSCLKYCSVVVVASQTQKVNLPKFRYPQGLLSVSDLQTMAKGNLPFSVNRNEAVIVSNLDNHPKKGGLFGNHLLISKAAAVKAAAVKAIPITLSERERAIIDNLNC